MIVRSDFLTEGLFGQVFAWMLEVLPHIDAQGWKPRWEIRTRNYGDPSNFNIFPGIITANYQPDADDSVQSFESLQSRYKHNFRHDFGAAHVVWARHFKFTEDVYQRLNEFWQLSFADDNVLGVHYRGTDKNVDTYQTNRVTQQQFLCAVEDFLESHTEVSGIFVASDDAKFIDAMNRFPNVHYYTQKRSENNQPRWNRHEFADNQAVAKEAILDCVTLARCRYGLKCMSQLSAFAKVMNPELEIYRISACKPSWFPEAYVPRYVGNDPAVRAMLAALQRGDFQESLLSKAATIHRHIFRLAKQTWRRRNRVIERVRGTRIEKS